MKSVMYMTSYHSFHFTVSTYSDIHPGVERSIMIIL